jgi:stress response protein YsnF
MATTIVGLFDKEQTAHHIRDEIKNRGLSTRSMDTITWRSLSEGNDPWGIGGKSGGDSPTGRLSSELQSRGVPATDAQEFAEAVRRGGNLVVTEIDDDQKADEIAKLMDREESVDLGSRREKWKEHGYSGFNPNADLYSSEEVEHERGRVLETGEEASFQEATEEVRVGKRSVETGGIRVSKRVEERDVEEKVNLREEHARVERTEGGGRFSGDDEDLFKEESIEMTEHAEEPVVEKNVRVTGEVHVGKEVEEHTETIRDTVRETVIDIENLSQDLGGERAFSEHGQDYREHYKTAFAGEGESYEDYEPAYRYGHTFGSSDRYRGKEYSAAEPDIRRSFEEKHGKGSFDRFGGAARHAYDRARNKRY